MLFLAWEKAMTDQNKLQKLKTVLKKYGQSHILPLGPAWPGQTDRLLAQIKPTDFAQLNRWREEFVLNASLLSCLTSLRRLIYAHHRATPGSGENTTRRVNWVTS